MEKKMHEMPVRIWAGPDQHRLRAGYWYDAGTGRQKEYIDAEAVWGVIKYVQHDHGCRINAYPDGGRCSCGLKDALLRVGGGGRDGEES